MSEADLHVLSGALAFGGTETLGAGAFRGISRSASEVAGLEREEENNNSSSSTTTNNNNNQQQQQQQQQQQRQQQQQQEQQQEQQEQEQQQQQEQQLARAGHCRGRPTRNSGNNRTEGKDERAGNTWRDGVTGEGAQGRCGRKHRSRRARASSKWRGRHARVASRVRSPREHGRHIPLHVPVLWGCRQQHCAFWSSKSPQALRQPISGQRWMRRDKDDGVPAPVLRWQSEQQRDDWENQPSQRVRQPVLCKDRQSQRGNAKTYAHMPAVPSGRVVSLRVRANPRAAQHTSGTPVHKQELDERGKERSIG